MTGWRTGRVIPLTIPGMFRGQISCRITSVPFFLWSISPVPPTGRLTRDPVCPRLLMLVLLLRGHHVTGCQRCPSSFSVLLLPPNVRYIKQTHTYLWSEDVSEKLGECIETLKGQYRGKVWSNTSEVQPNEKIYKIAERIEIILYIIIITFQKLFQNFKMLQINLNK